jgi:hypothetical protein
LKVRLADDEWHPVPAWQARAGLIVVPPTAVPVPCGPRWAVPLIFVAAPGDGTRVIGWHDGQITIPGDTPLLAWDGVPLALAA